MRRVEKILACILAGAVAGSILSFTPRSSIHYASLLTGQPTAPLALTNLTLIDGNGGAPKPRMTLVIAGGRIVEILDAQTKPPAAARTIDLGGGYVIPGLIDSHVHLTGAGREDQAVRDKQLRTLLLGGVTSVRDMGGDGVTLAALAKAGEDAATLSPRIYFSAVMAGPTWFSDPRARATAHGMTPGKIAWQRALTAETDFKQAVAEAKASGATGIKLYADLGPEVLAKTDAEAVARGFGYGVTLRCCSASRRTPSGLAWKRSRTRRCWALNSRRNCPLQRRN